MHHYSVLLKVRLLFSKKKCCSKQHWCLEMSVRILLFSFFQFSSAFWISLAITVGWGKDNQSSAAEHGPLQEGQYPEN